MWWWILFLIGSTCIAFPTGNTLPPIQNSNWCQSWLAGHFHVIAVPGMASIVFVSKASSLIWFSHLCWLPPCLIPKRQTPSIKLVLFAESPCNMATPPVLNGTVPPYNGLPKVLTVRCRPQYLQWPDTLQYMVPAPLCSSLQCTSHNLLVLNNKGNTSTCFFTLWALGDSMMSYNIHSCVYRNLSFVLNNFTHPTKNHSRLYLFLVLVPVWRFLWPHPLLSHSVPSRWESPPPTHSSAPHELSFLYKQHSKRDAFSTGDIYI